MNMPVKNASAAQEGPTGPDLYFIATVALCGFLFLLPAVPYLECGSCGGFTVPMVALVAAAASGLLAALFWYWAAFSASNPVASQVAAGLSGVTVMMAVSLLVGSMVGFPAWVSQFGPWFFYLLGFLIAAVLMNISITVLGSSSGRVATSTPSRPRTPQALLAAPMTSLDAVSLTGSKDTVR